MLVNCLELRSAQLGSHPHGPLLLQHAALLFQHTSEKVSLATGPQPTRSAPTCPHSRACVRPRTRPARACAQSKVTVFCYGITGAGKTYTMRRPQHPLRGDPVPRTMCSALFSASRVSGPGRELASFSRYSYDLKGGSFHHSTMFTTHVHLSWKDHRTGPGQPCHERARPALP